jgi:hypothetical protein
LAGNIAVNNCFDAKAALAERVALARDCRSLRVAEIRNLTIDSFGLGWIDLIKIDVEGPCPALSDRPYSKKGRSYPVIASIKGSAVLSTLDTAKL